MSEMAQQIKYLKGSQKHIKKTNKYTKPTVP